jgi:hypothetical protein
VTRRLRKVPVPVDPNAPEKVEVHWRDFSTHIVGMKQAPPPKLSMAVAGLAEAYEFRAELRERLGAGNCVVNITRTGGNAPKEKQRQAALCDPEWPPAARRLT